MDLQSLHTNITSDALLLTSTADYFESKIERAVDCVNDISEVITHIDDDGYVLPEFNYNITVEVDDVVEIIDPHDFIQKVFQGYLEYTTTAIETGHQITVKIDDVIDQLKDSLLANRVMVEAIYTLRDAGVEEISSISSLFVARLQLRIGEVTDTASSLGVKFLEVLTQTGVSVGDRLRNLLSFIGIYNVNENVPDLGVPSSDLTDITGTNVYQAWISSVPQNIVEFFNWLVDTVKKIINMFKSMVEVVVGSGVYRSLRKFVSTLTLEADSFDYNSATEDDQSIDSHGRTFKIKGMTYSQYWLNYSQDTIFGLTKNLYLSTYSSEVVISYSTVNSLLEGLCNRIYNESFTDNSPLKSFMLGNSRIHNTPTWLTHYDSWDTTVESKAQYIYYNIACRYYYLSTTFYPGLCGMLQYSLGALMDFFHINDGTSFTRHLYSTQYTKIDLPCSTLYMWLVGNDVYVTRRVSPCSKYMDYTFSQTMSEIDQLFQYQELKSRPGSGLKRYRLYTDSIFSFISTLRSGSPGWIDTDERMKNAVFASHYIDAMYLSLLCWADGSSISFTSDIQKIDTPDFIEANMASFFPLLTGRSLSAYNSAFSSLQSQDITNLTLAKMLGADVSFTNYRFIDNLIRPLRYLFAQTSSDDTFMPYALSGALNAGRYHVITNSELAGITSTLIKVVVAVVAAVYLMKKMGQLKRKALQMRTTAEATAWKQVNDGVYDQNALELQYKMERRANLCQKCSEALFGSVSKVVTSVGSGMTNTIAGLTGKVKQVLSGSRTTASGDQLSLSDILTVITG